MKKNLAASTVETHGPIELWGYAPTPPGTLEVSKH